MKKVILVFLAVFFAGCGLFQPPPVKKDVVELERKLEERLLINKIDSLHLENERKKVEMSKLMQEREQDKVPTVTAKLPRRVARVENKDYEINLKEVVVKPERSVRVLRVKNDKGEIIFKEVIK